MLPNPTLAPPVAVSFADGSPRALAVASAHGRHLGHQANVAWVDGHATLVAVRLYADQPATERTDELGFLAPNLEERSNEWMFVK
jgi:prepilin-type processing-associated H-X9-DG protein